MIANWPEKLLARTSHILWCSEQQNFLMHRLSKNHTPASSREIMHFQHTKRRKGCEFQFCMVVSALVWLLMVYAMVTCIRPSYFIAYIFSIAYTRRVLAHAWTLQSHQSMAWFCTYFCYNCNDSHRILVWSWKFT